MYITTFLIIHHFVDVKSCQGLNDVAAVNWHRYRNRQARLLTIKQIIMPRSTKNIPRST